MLSEYCFSEGEQRDFNPRFQQPHRSHFVAPYPNQMRGSTQRHLQSQGKKWVCVCGFGIMHITSITALCLSSVHVYVCSYLTEVSNKTCISYTVVYCHLKKVTLQGEVVCSIVICSHLLLTVFWEISLHVVFVIFMLGLSWTVLKIVIVLKINWHSCTEMCLKSLAADLVHTSTKHSSISMNKVKHILKWFSRSESLLPGHCLSDTNASSVLPWH